MTVELQMPALSPTMESGTLAKWHVQVGDKVTAGMLLADIETDKAVMEFEAVDEGTVGALLVEAGTEGIAVNSPIAFLLEEGESPDDVPPVSSQSDKAKDIARNDAVGAAQAPAQSQKNASHGKPASVGQSEAASSPSAHQSQPISNNRRIFASPAARRLAMEKNIALEGIAGRGPQGRIVLADIAAHKSPLPIASSSGTDDAESLHIMKTYADRQFEEIPVTGARKVIARRLGESKSTIPHFYLRRQVRIDALLSLRSDMNATLSSTGRRLSVNDFVIKASALALQEVPKANVVWAGDRILRFAASDVAVAVAVEDGLYTPVICDAHSKSMLEISAEMKDLATRARAGALKPEEYTGGAFSISNLGMYGVDSFEAIINPPQGSILAVGAAMRTAIEGNDGKTAFASTLTLTLSADHRMIDGALGAEFLGAIAKFLEDPLLILI